MLDWVDAATAQHVLHFLPYIILLYWGLVSFAVIVTCLPVPGVPQGFKAAVALSAARGKTWASRSAALGALSHVSVPHSWFSHFYMTGSLVNAVTLAGLLLRGVGRKCAGQQRCSWRHSDTEVADVSPVEDGCSQAEAISLLALLLFQVHLLRRLYETTLIQRYPPHARMHLLAYLFGLSYYVVVSLSLLPFNSMQATTDQLAVQIGASESMSLSRGSPTASGTILERGQLQKWLALALGRETLGVSSPELGLALEALEQLRSCTAVALDGIGMMGMLVFTAGNAMQYVSHVMLARLSAELRDRSPGPWYRIPRGFLFEWVSCPHYLAEIVVYVGLLLLTRGCWPAVLLMNVWVVFNLVLGARDMHCWYRKTFPDYPPNRCALVPLLL